MKTIKKQLLILQHYSIYLQQFTSKVNKLVNVKFTIAKIDTSIDLTIVTTFKNLSSAHV